MTEYSDTYWNNLLEQYRSGTISKDDQFKLEKKALDDPFLFDALEGFSHVNEHVASKGKPRGSILTLPKIAAAASIIFLLSMIFLLKNDSAENLPSQESIAMVLDTESNDKNGSTNQEGSNFENQSSTESKTENNLEEDTINKRENQTKQKISDSSKSIKSSPNTENREHVSERINTSPAKSKKKKKNVNNPKKEKSTLSESEDLKDKENATKTESPNHYSRDILMHDQSAETADINDAPPIKKPKTKTEEEKTTIFYKVVPAIGIKDFEEYVNESIEKRELSQNPPLDVTIEFDINADGTLTNFLHIFNGCSECGAYAIFLLSGSGIWKTIPEGQVGRARFTLTF